MDGPGGGGGGGGDGEPFRHSRCFTDGSGRISRAAMERVLQDAGLRSAADTHVALPSAIQVTGVMCSETTKPQNPRNPQTAFTRFV